MSSVRWQFAIDVGGTFTDVVARCPSGRILTHKILSNNATRSTIDARPDDARIISSARIGDPPNFWEGYRIALLDIAGKAIATSTVKHFDATMGTMLLAKPISELDGRACAYSLTSDEPAPVMAIRYLMGRCLHEPIGPVEVRLGTTRATNALLERKGARTAFVTTLGFADVLRIGYQDRPHLFELNIKKREELAEVSVEIHERISATGEVLRAPDRDSVARKLEALRTQGIEALAICLLHSPVNSVHEELVASVAESIGFDHVSVSSRICPIEKLVPRGDTTVADAYLSGVIRRYVAAIVSALPEAHFLLMTSNGGLVGANHVTGKDTILSGPAGGVVGCAYVSKRAGYTRVIGFDMGGTSTDVTRIDTSIGEFEYQDETVKAGIRLMTPMLAVETVAAGGGSICSFDGQMLHVGPQSAGAEPGPVCYGRGGPLTITDVNLFLGRITEDYFPFPLDSNAVERVLDKMCEQIGTNTRKALTPLNLAEGFVRVANANMASAIQQISVAKGYDVRDYVLTSFGGAGGQHACAVARHLGMTEILFHPSGGVLSALGIGVAYIKRIAQRSVDVPVSPSVAVDLSPAIEALTSDLQREMEQEGVPPDGMRTPQCTAALCYQGQASTISVSLEPCSTIATRFEEAHRRLYGYAHQGREIRVRVVQVELCASGRTTWDQHDSEQLDANVATNQDLIRRTLMVVEGKRQEVPLFYRDELVANQTFSGPAIVVERTGTVVIEAGWTATITEQSDLILRYTQVEAKAPVASAEVDPISLELFNNQFRSIAEQMGVTLRRTALSTNVKERLDFSCAIFTPTGDLVVNAPHIPVHLGGMSACVKAMIEDVARFIPGDALVTNDPYRGGSHLNDITMITPVFDRNGQQLQFFVASRAHHAEIGGKTPGSMPPDSRNLAEEGVLIRATYWTRGGVVNDEALRTLLTQPPYPSRAPLENLADLGAQAAANERGVAELRALVAQHGIDVVQRHVLHVQRAAEQKMSHALSRLTPGTYRFEDSMDGADGGVIRVCIQIGNGQAKISFDGTSEVLEGNLNANRAIVSSATLYCLRCLIDEDIPLNSGVLAPVELTLPTCFLNPPSSNDARDCPAVAGGNVETSQRVVDTIFGALGIVAASQGTMNNVLVGDDNFGYYETICGGAGAGPSFDGADAVHTHMTNTRITDPEVLEREYPLRLWRFGIRRGSGGKGKFHGGDGVVREIEFLAPLHLSIISQRRTKQPYGLWGGQPGLSGRNTLYHAQTDRTIELEGITHLRVEPGDRLTIETPGGGGYGSKE